MTRLAAAGAAGGLQVELDGTVAVVIGASQGIGQAIAVALAHAGSTVVAVARAADRVAETAALADPARGTVICAAADVADPATVTALAARVRSEHGPASVLVNSAGQRLAKPAMDVTPQEWDTVLDTQLRGTFFSCQAFAGQMADAGYGKIVNLGSTWAATVGLGRAVYGTAKAGVHHLTSCLAVEWAPLGIRVNAVAPGATMTADTRARFDADPDRLQRMTTRTPLGRLADPADVVGAALFLSSRASDFVTGETIFVDGGWRWAT